MKLVMSRDGITYELGATCTFQICISGRLPPEMNSEADVVEQLAALLEQADFFKHMAVTLKTSTYQEKRRNYHDDEDETWEPLDDDVPF